MSKRIGKSLVVSGSTLVTEAAWNAELDAKHEKLIQWMRGKGLAGVLLRRNENIAWVTGGAVEGIVCTAAETGTYSVLVTAAGTVGIGLFPNFFINAVNWSLGLVNGSHVAMIMH